MRGWVGIVALGMVAGCGARTGLGIDDASPPARDGGARRDEPDAGPMLPPDHDPTGLWITEVEPPTLPTVFALHRRAHGELLGYVLGGTPVRVIAGGRSELDGRIEMHFEVRDPLRASMQSRTGVVDGDVIDLDPIPDGGSTNRLLRFREPIAERRWVLHQGSGAPVHRYDVAGAFGGVAGEEFFGGGLVARDDCTPICSGRVVGWREAPGGPVISAESAPCSTYTLTVSRGSALWEMTDCMGGAFSGEFLARAAPGTTGRDVLGILATLGRHADDWESRREFPRPYALVSPAYRHGDLDERSLIGEWNGDVATEGPFVATVGFIRNIATTPPAGEPAASDPNVWSGHTADFRWTRISMRGGSGDDFDTTFATPGTAGVANRLAFLRLEGATWRFVGRDVR